MRVFCCIVVLVIALGCHAKHPLTKEEVFDANIAMFVHSKEPSRVVQPDIVEQIPSRLGSLKSGMTPEQVFRALQLPNNLSCFAGDGDPKYYRLGFLLHTNRYLVLRFNMTQRPPSFIDAQLGAGWGDLQHCNGPTYHTP
jgi:hypothetical protein